MHKRIIAKIITIAGARTRVDESNSGTQMKSDSSLKQSFPASGSATKKKEPENIREILAAKNRKQAGATAPASGLFLERVNY